MDAVDEYKKFFCAIGIPEDQATDMAVKTAETAADLASLNPGRKMRLVKKIHAGLIYDREALEILFKQTIAFLRK